LSNLFNDPRDKIYELRKGDFSMSPDQVERLLQVIEAGKTAQRLAADLVAELGREDPAFGLLVEAHQHGEVAAARARQALEVHGLGDR
jgi:hypothetical protein